MNALHIVVMGGLCRNISLLRRSRHDCVMQCLVIRLLGGEEHDGLVLKTALQSFPTNRQAPVSSARL